MPVSKAQQKAVNKYMAANYDRINLTVPKGKKDIIHAHAAQRGESVNGFINRAIGETIDRDLQEGPLNATGTAQTDGAISLSPKTTEPPKKSLDGEQAGRTEL